MGAGGGSSEAKGIVPELLARNLGLKLFSLVLGLVIFFAVRNEQEVTTSVAVRLLVREPPALTNTAAIPEHVTVQLAGTSGRMRSLEPRLLGPVELDLSAYEEGVSVVRIREEQLGLPADIRVLSISPSAVDVRLVPKGSAAPARAPPP